MFEGAIRINAVAFLEGDAWVVQGIEYDIAAHAYDVEKLPDAFLRAVVENLCISEHLGRPGLSGIKPGPAHFREMYEKAGIEMRSLKPIDGRFSVPPEIAVRVLDRHAG